MNVTHLASKRILVLIDGSNMLGHLNGAAYSRIDAQAFWSWCATFGRPTIKWFQGGWAGTAPFFAHLRAAGITVDSKVPVVRSDGSAKADMDMEMGLAAIAAIGTYDTVILVTADGDFVPVVEALQRAGVAVHLLSPTARTAHALLRAIDDDKFYDLDDELPYFGFNPREAA